MTEQTMIDGMPIVASPYPELGRLGREAIEHWKQHLPRMAAALEARGELAAAAQAAEEATFNDQYEIEMSLRRQGYTAQQAIAAAWEMVRERYLFLPAEQSPAN